MTIRMATLADLPALAAVEAACFPVAEAATEAELRDRLTHYADHFWLLLDGDRLVSFVDGMVTDQADLTDDLYADAAKHDEHGAWQMIFGVNTLPADRRHGYAAALLHQTTSQLYRMAESYERGRILREGVPCVILGRPNAGKSTLLNTLLGRERAIVTDIPGTTRDLIEENVKVGQILLRVTDTAGLRDTTDPVEQAGIDRAMAEASASALILAVFDGSKPIGEEDMLVLARSAGHRAIAVLNKADLPQQLDEELLKKQFAHIVHLSAKTGEGMDRLLSLIPRTIGFGETAFDGALITNARQAAALARAAERCEAALYAAQCGMTPDAVVMDAEGAIAALGEITGETVTESVVTRIFSDFCVGK